MLTNNAVIGQCGNTLVKVIMPQVGTVTILP